MSGRLGVPLNWPIGKRIGRALWRIRVSDKGCWVWIGQRHNNGGYAWISIQGKRKRLHRIFYEYCFGSFDTRLEIRHRCGNPQCVNPLHLKPGTHKLNMEDMVRHGRSQKGRLSNLYGERNGMAKLKDVDIIEIRDRLGRGARQIDLASKFAVARQTIWKIQHGKHRCRG